VRLRVRVERSNRFARECIATLSCCLRSGALRSIYGAANGPEFIAKAVRDAGQAGCRTLYIEPGESVENPFIESFNGKLRDEFLNMTLSGAY